MEIVTKQVDAAVESINSSNPNGEFHVVLSTDALDRDGEHLYPNEWKTPLPERITFDSDHGMSVATTVGSGKPFINEAGQLQVRGVFASTAHAQNVRTLVNEGHITTTSVAFRQAKNGDAVQRELLNGAFVAVPANPEAVVLSSKAVSEPAKAAGMGDMVQAIHDAACHLGADCAADVGDENAVNPKSYPYLFDLISRRLATTTKSSGLQAGSPQESAEESAVAAVKAAAPEATAESTAMTDESAETVALRAKVLAFKLGAKAIS